jgi:hypothetical protein
MWVLHSCLLRQVHCWHHWRDWELKIPVLVEVWLLGLVWVNFGSASENKGVKRVMLSEEKRRTMSEKNRRIYCKQELPERAPP